jgi:AcrR family transcriptional regulator
MLKASAQIGVTTKGRIIDAALQTLKEEGFAGTSARAIARRGNFNQALIFYHFGTLDDLMLAALDKTSIERMERYREAMSNAESLEARVAAASELYREDLESGHITVISELLTGSLSRPDLGPEVVERVEPWVAFAEEAIGEILSSMGLGEIVAPRVAAFAVVALYLGVDLLSHLDGDHSRAEAMFETASRITPLISPLFQGRP